jgi:hypothetical protein
MLPPPPVLAPPGGADVLVGLTVMLGTGVGGAVVAVVDGAGVGGAEVGGLAGGVDGFGVGVWQVHVGEGDGVGVWQVQVGVGVGVGTVGAGVGWWQVHVGVGVGLFPPPPWLLALAATTPALAVDRVVACAAVLVIMNAATPKAKQPDSTRRRIDIALLSLDRSPQNGSYLVVKQARSIACFNAAKRLG